MIKAELEKGRLQKFVICGTMEDLENEAALIIGLIYAQINRASSPTASAFRAELLRHLNAPGSPIWSNLAMEGIKGVSLVFSPQPGGGDPCE